MRHTTRRALTTPASRDASTPARRACAAFGLVAEPSPFEHRPDTIDARDARRLLSCSVALITGSSGSGKSTTLRAVRALAGGRAVVVEPIRDADRCAFDAIRAGPKRTLDALASAGLAEPALWVRPTRALSVGEHARLSLARAMAHATKGDTLVCDEFASNLDRVGAGALAHTAARWARRSGVGLLVAGAHEDLPGLLDADLVYDAGSRTLRPGGAHAPALRVEPGDLGDYQCLARYHYLGARPATVRRVLRCVRSTSFGEMLAGVLVASAPVLNGVWRDLAWPGRYTAGTKDERARRLNREVCCVSRVVVEPRSRGLGVSSALVRAYLGSPLSPATEAVAAMGAVCPFFARAGMTEYRLPMRPCDARLADALAHERLTTNDLTDPCALDRPLLRRELARWARDARITIDDTDPLPHLARHAVCRLASSPRAYAWSGGTHGGTNGPEHT